MYIICYFDQGGNQAWEQYANENDMNERIEDLGNTLNCSLDDIKIFKENELSFTDDWEKMRDFFHLTKEEFLNSYSYLNEEEYLATLNEVLGTDYGWYFDKEHYIKLKEQISNSTQKADVLVGKVYKGELCIELYARYTDKTLNPRVNLFYSVYVGGVKTENSFNVKYPYDYVGGGEIPIDDEDYKDFIKRAEYIFSWYIHERSLTYTHADLIDKARYGIY